MKTQLSRGTEFPTRLHVRHNEDAYHSVYPRSLIRVFAEHPVGTQDDKEDW